MGNLTLPTITDCQRSTAGIRRLRITALGSYDNLGQVATGATIYDIAFAQDTGRVSERDSDSRAGVSVDQSCSVYIPRRRSALEVMRRELRDRRVVVEVTDQHDQKIVMPSARVLLMYDSGEQLGDRSGYTLEISGSRVASRINRFVLPVTGGDGDGETVGTSGDDGLDDGGGTPTPSEDCCITIQTTMLTTPPQLMNNATHLRNKLYRVQDGSVWIIDHAGNAMKISNAKATQQLDGPSSGSQSVYALNYPISHTVGDATAMIVVRAGSVQTYVDGGTAFSGFNQFKLSGSDIELSLALSNGESALIHYI